MLRARERFRGRGSADLLVLSFSAPLLSSTILSRGTGVATFTRATTATVVDFEGLLKTAKAGEPRFTGARRVENLWGIQSATLAVAAANTITLTAGDYVFSMGIGTGTATFSGTGGVTGTLTASVTNRKSVLKTVTAGTFIVTGSVAALTDLQIENVTGQTNQNPSEYVSNGVAVGLVGNELLVNGDFASATGWTIGANWSISGGVATKTAGAQKNIDQAILTIGKKYSLTFTITSLSAGQINVYIGSSTFQLGYVSVGTYTFNGTCAGSTSLIIQGNSACVATIDNVSVKETTYHGAGIDGVKYFTTENGNTVASNVVTEATGANIPDATLKGVQIEKVSTNLALQSADFSSVSWIKVGAVASAPTVTANQTIGVMGGLTASSVVFPIVSAGYSIVYQRITARTASVYLKGSVGGERVYLMETPDGVTYTNKECILTTSWKRFELVKSASVYVFWQIGIDKRDVTQTSTVAAQTIFIDAFQTEDVPFASSYIPTTTASVTRNADVLTFPNAGNVNDRRGTIFMEATPAFDIPSGVPAGYGNNVLIDFGVDRGLIQCMSGYLTRKDFPDSYATPAWLPLKNTTYKIGSRWGSTGQQNVLSGTAGTVFVFDGSFSAGTNMTIGGYSGDTSYNWGGNTRNISIWNKSLSATYLQDLTVSIAMLVFTTAGAANAINYTLFF